MSLYKIESQYKTVTNYKKMKTYYPVFAGGHYVDNMELFERGKTGEYHMCECRQNHDAFANRSSFMAHIKLKCHQYWLTTIEPPSTNELEPITVEPPTVEPTLNPLTLREEQDSEYERALKEDQKKVMDKQDEEMRQIIQASEEAYQNEMGERLLQEKRKLADNDHGYTIRFVFPNGKKLSAKIPEKNTIAFMRNHVDVYMADSCISIPQYEFFIYPNKTLDEGLVIKDELSHRTTVYIRNLEN